MKEILIRLLDYVFMVIRNGLYLPYVTALCLYLFFLFMFVAGLFLSNQWGIDFVNSIIHWMIAYNIIDINAPDIQTYSTAEETTRQLVYVIVGFGIGYDLLTRIIRYFKKDFDHTVFQFTLLKYVGIFYLITTIFSIIIIGFIIKSWAFFWGFVAILVFNALSLLWAMGVTKLFGFVRKFISQITLPSNLHPLP